MSVVSLSDVTKRFLRSIVVSSACFIPPGTHWAQPGRSVGVLFCNHQGYCTGRSKVAAERISDKAIKPIGAGQSGRIGEFVANRKEIIRIGLRNNVRTFELLVHSVRLDQRWQEPGMRIVVVFQLRDADVSVIVLRAWGHDMGLAESLVADVLRVHSRV